jgi:hypothetical protein
MVILLVWALPVCAMEKSRRDHIRRVDAMLLHHGIADTLVSVGAPSSRLDMSALRRMPTNTKVSSTLV